MQSGYFSPDYGTSFSDIGEIVTLPHSGLKLLKREIVANMFDYVGLYPFAVCNQWSMLARDAEFLRDSGAVSVVLVSNPFSVDAFPESVSNWSVCRRFKTHYVVDLRQDWREQRSRSVKYHTRRGFKLQSVEQVTGTADIADEFWALYQRTIDRHHVTGIQRLSHGILSAHLAIEGASLVVARNGETMTGALLSYRHERTAHAHLMCLSDEAYEANTTYALYYAALAALEDHGCHYVSLGGPAGLRETKSDGLAQFKRNWANDQRATYLCGNVLDHERYDTLLMEGSNATTEFFPAYRFPGGPYEW